MTGRKLELQNRDGQVRLDSLRAALCQQRKLGNMQPAAGTEFLDQSSGLLQTLGGVSGGSESSLQTTNGTLTVNPTNKLLIGTGLVLANSSPGVAQLSSPRSAFYFGGNNFGPVIAHEGTLSGIATVSSAITGNAVVTGSVHTYGSLLGPPKQMVLSLYTMVSGVPTTLLASASSNDGSIVGFPNGVYASVTAILPVVPGTQINLFITPYTTSGGGGASYAVSGSMNMLVVP